MDRIEELRAKANRLPLLPGVYIMLDEAGEVIYVGKAKALKNRVTSYFRGEHLPKVAAMVEKVRDFNVIVASSEFEALVLENSLIKRHKPHYNILLKDDKGYPFIRLDVRSEYPRFSIVSRTEEDGARYFGPYGGRGMSYNIIDTISKALLLPTCSREFPRDIGRDRPCLNYHMGVCQGWCLKDADAGEYRRLMREAEMILDGRSSELVKTLTEQMLAAAEDMRFEQAARLRDRIKAISGLANRQRVIGAVAADTDAVGFYRGARTCFAVLHYTGGDLSSKDYELLEEPLETDDEAIAALVRQYYTACGVWPKTILLPVDIDGAEDLARLFSEEAGRRVYIETPKRGDRLRLVEAAGRNAREEAERAATAQQKRMKSLEWLQKALELPELPTRIEAYDISNTGNTGIVAAMTVFQNGRPLKRDYRKFRIKSEDGELHQDDYGSMRQVLERRFRRYLDGDEGFNKRPDLLLIDGGRTHAATAESVVRGMGLTIPVVGMVKDDRHRTRALIDANGRETGINTNQAVFALVGSIQEETHRTAIEYHRYLRDGGFGSELDKINGVGKARRAALLKHFKTIKAIKAASLAELCEAVPKSTARAVYEHYHGPMQGADAGVGGEK